MEINEIVEKAIPCESCPVKNEGAMYRRDQLKKRILAYTAHQLSTQFNARPEQMKHGPVEYKS